MVKNTKGGSGHKKFARKHVAVKTSTYLRESVEECEIYAIVTKLLGNNMFHCISIGGVTCLGHIRGKFAGRGKRDNTIVTGTWILVGMREWEDSSKKYPHCDLLEVYSDSDKLRLKDTIDADWKVLENNDMSKVSGDKAGHLDGFEFSTEADFERERIAELLKTDSGDVKKIGIKTLDEDNNIISVDDL